MKQVVLITGANGMIARQLAVELEGECSVRFLTRHKNKKNEYLWDIDNKYIEPEALFGVNIIIHLAGLSIAKRWTRKRKKNIVSSRVDSANLILNELKKRNLSIDTFISASAVGYYGAKTTNEIFDENSSKGNDFLSDVCAKWENKANEFKLNGLAKRVVILRFGIIFSKTGGAFKRIFQPIKYGIGAGLGSGKQYVPWIHIYDLIRIFHLILNSKNMSGAYNAVAPEYITNIELTKIIAQYINKHILFPNIPAFIIKIMYGEMSKILLEGNKISSKKILDEGFVFKYGKIREALDVLIENN